MNPLQNWQRASLEKQRNTASYETGRTEVTLLAYHFWDGDLFDDQFDYLECAIRETWRHCGLLKTVLVVNRLTPRVERFGAEFDGWVRFEVAEELIPGKIHSMSVDCNARLHRRFETPYVLVIQNDGFPIRSGLDAFVGEWDFIGAPYVRNTWRNRIVCGALNCWVSNGGFSLRSKRICELAAHYWRKKYCALPDSRTVSEDVFFTETLPLRERAYRRAVRIAAYPEAVRFSYDAAFPYAEPVPPFGFHGLKAFEFLRQAGWVPDAGDPSAAQEKDGPE